MAVSLYGENSVLSKLRNQLKRKHAFVFENSDFLDLITPDQGYTGPWGGYGKSAFLFSPDNQATEPGGSETLDGLFNIYNVFTKEIQ